MTRYAYSYLNGTTDTGLRQSVIDSVANTTTTYTYDGVNRLTRAQTTPNTGGTGNPSDYQYGYDATGNRTSTTIGGAGAAASFNEADEQTDWNTGQDRTYTYDANGNETGSSANESRAYNSRNQTVSITGLNGIPTGMGYLDGGQGERATAGGSAYVNDSLGVASKTKGGQTTYYTRTPSGHLVSQRTPTATYYYLFDGLGSVVGMVDPFGNVAARYGYDPYGQTVTKTGPDNNPGYLTIADGNPFRYTGAYLDSTGLYKMGERYYDPARGRFTQLDPLGNGYVYASDNPVNFTDPTGLCDPEECEPAPGTDPNEPYDPFAEPLDPRKIDYSSPPEGYPEISFNMEHIFRDSHGWPEGTDQGEVTQRIAEDIYRHYQIGEVPQAGFFKNTTDYFVNGGYQPFTYQAYVMPDGNISVGTSYPGYSNR